MGHSAPRAVDGVVARTNERRQDHSRDQTLNSQYSQAPYTTKIIKAGAFLADTKTLLAHWDLDSSVPDNLQRIQHENIFGKASRSRVEDILRIFRQRYLTETPAPLHVHRVPCGHIHHGLARE